MQMEKFMVKNVKCGGCVSTIHDGLLNLAGVKDVAVVIQGGEVTVSGEGLDHFNDNTLVDIALLRA